MKKIALFLVQSLLIVAGVHAQGYESQYPYDPYNPAPQPQQNYNYSTYPSNKDYSGGGGDYGDTTSPMLSYGYLSGQYAYNDFKGDNKLEGESGFGIDLGLELMKPLFLHFGLDRITGEGPNAQKLEVTTVTGAAGLYLPFASRFHAFAEVGVRYDFVDGDYDVVYTDDFSVFVRPGIRVAVTDRFELAGAVLFNNTDNFNEFVIEVDAYFAVLDWLDLNVGVDFSEDINSYQLGGRWRW